MIFDMINRNQYYDNPFINEVDMDISNKMKIIANVGNKSIVDTSTGEIIPCNVFAMSRKRKDVTPFIKMFSTGIFVLSKLSSCSVNVLMYILSTLNFKEDFILFDYKKCMEFTGYKSKSYIRVGLTGLIKYLVIAKGGKNIYYINPSMFYKGDRMKFGK
jgi:hypothetical protein